MDTIIVNQLCLAASKEAAYKKSLEKPDGNGLPLALMFAASAAMFAGTPPGYR